MKGESLVNITYWASPLTSEIKKIALCTSLWWSGPFKTITFYNSGWCIVEVQAMLKKFMWSTKKWSFLYEVIFLKKIRLNSRKGRVDISSSDPCKRWPIFKWGTTSNWFAYNPYNFPSLPILSSGLKQTFTAVDSYCLFSKVTTK